MAAVIHRGRGRRTISEINMVPFIDVMLVLLIIFMVTAPLIAPSVIDLPSVARASKSPDQVLQIIIGPDESLALKIDHETTELALDGIARAVLDAQGGAAGSAKTAVVISADKSVRYESVVRVMDTLQQAGVARIGLSVQLTP